MRPSENRGQFLGAARGGLRRLARGREQERVERDRGREHRRRPAEARRDRPAQEGHEANPRSA